MVSSNYLFGLAVVMIAAGAGALLASNEAWSLMVIACGLAVWIAGAKRQATEKQSERNKRFHDDYSFAVNGFLNILGDAYIRFTGEDGNGKKALVNHVKECATPEPNTWHALPDSQSRHLREFFLAVYSGLLDSDERAELMECRKTMLRYYEDWSAEIENEHLLGNGGFDAWLKRIRRNHGHIFKLWLYAQHARAESEGTSATGLQPFQALIKRWLQPSNITPRDFDRSEVHGPASD